MSKYWFKDVCLTIREGWLDGLEDIRDIGLECRDVGVGLIILLQLVVKLSQEGECVRSQDIIWALLLE